MRATAFVDVSGEQDGATTARVYAVVRGMVLDHAPSADIGHEHVLPQHVGPREYLKMNDATETTTALLVSTMWRELLNSDSFDEYDITQLGAVSYRIPNKILGRIPLVVPAIFDEKMKDYREWLNVSRGLLSIGGSSDDIAG